MSFKHILYLKETRIDAKIYYEEEIKTINNIKSELKRMACKHLFSIDGYLFALRKELSMKYKIPIYFSTKLFLFYFKTKEELFLINLFAIYKILYNGNIVILFNNGEILELSGRKETILKQLKMANVILNYINNL